MSEGKRKSMGGSSDEIEIHSNFMKYSKAQLEAQCSKLGLDAVGTKKDLVDRLKGYAAKHPSAAAMGSPASEPVTPAAKIARTGDNSSTRSSSRAASRNSMGVSAEQLTEQEILLVLWEIARSHFINTHNLNVEAAGDVKLSVYPYGAANSVVEPVSISFDPKSSAIELLLKVALQTRLNPREFTLVIEGRALEPRFSARANGAKANTRADLVMNSELQTYAENKNIDTLSPTKIDSPASCSLC